MASQVFTPFLLIKFNTKAPCLKHYHPYHHTHCSKKLATGTSSFPAATLTPQSNNCLHTRCLTYHMAAPNPACLEYLSRNIDSCTADSSFPRNHAQSINKYTNTTHKQMRTYTHTQTHAQAEIHTHTHTKCCPYLTWHMAAARRAALMRTPPSPPMLLRLLRCALLPTCRKRCVHVPCWLPQRRCMLLGCCCVFEVECRS